MAGWLPLFAPGGFNGGRSQGNLFFLGGTDFAFKNLLLTAQSWTYADSKGWPAPDELNANGYPLNAAMSRGGVFTSFRIPTQTQKSGDYVIITTGTGTVFCAGTSTPVSGTNTETTVLGSVLGSNTSITVYITAADATTPISKMAFVHNTEKAAYYADNYAFGTEFINTMTSLKWGVIRFLDWQQGNATNETNWASRKPQTYFSYGTGHFLTQQTDAGLSRRIGYLGQTTSAGNDYSISDSVGTAAPVDKQTICLKYDDAAVAVTNSSVTGVAAVTSWTSHGLSTGMPFSLFTLDSGSAPGGLTLYPKPGIGGPEVYYAIVIDANSMRFATSYANAIANTAISTTSTGSSVRAHWQVIDNAITVTIATSTVNWPHHFLATGDVVGACGKNPAGNISLGINYYAIVVDADNIKLATTRANALALTAVTMTGAADNSATFVRQPTLNLNGTGAVPIRLPDGSCMAFGSNGTPTSRIYRDHVTYGSLMYDAVLNCWVQYGGSQAKGEPGGIASGVPPEICLKLATQLRAHPYFVTPMYACDPLTDYMPSLMQYVKDNKPTWMIPRFETYNESWNGNTYSSHLQFKSWAYWAVAEFPAWNMIGKNASVLGQAANAIWSGGKGTQYHILAGVQTGLYTNSTAAANQNPMLTAAQYVAQGAAAQSPYLKDPAYKWISHVAAAQYVSPQLYGDATEDAKANTWVSAGSLPNDSNIKNYVASLGITGGNGFNIPDLNTKFGVIYTWAQGAGVSGGWNGLYQLRMCGYEGGFSFDPGGAANTVLFRQAARDSIEAAYALTGGTFTGTGGTTVTGIYNSFIAAGGEFPSCYYLAGATTHPWAMINPDIYNRASMPSYAAIVAFNA